MEEEKRMKKRLPTVYELKELSDHLISTLDIPKDTIEEIMEEGLFIVAEDYILTNDLIGLDGGSSSIQNIIFGKIMVCVWDFNRYYCQPLVEVYRWVDGKISKLEPQKKENEKIIRLIDGKWVAVE